MAQFEPVLIVFELLSPNFNVPSPLNSALMVTQLMNLAPWVASASLKWVVSVFNWVVGICAEFDWSTAPRVIYPHIDVLHFHWLSYPSGFAVDQPRNCLVLIGGWAPVTIVSVIANTTTQVSILNGVDRVNFPRQHGCVLPDVCMCIAIY